MEPVKFRQLCFQPRAKRKLNHKITTTIIKTISRRSEREMDVSEQIKVSLSLLNGDNTNKKEKFKESHVYLNNFKRTPGSWRICLDIVINNAQSMLNSDDVSRAYNVDVYRQNEYVILFSAQTLFDKALSGSDYSFSDRLFILSSSFQYLFIHHSFQNVPSLSSASAQYMLSLQHQQQLSASVSSSSSSSNENGFLLKSKRNEKQVTGYVIPPITRYLCLAYSTLVLRAIDETQFTLNSFIQIILDDFHSIPETYVHYKHIIILLCIQFLAEEATEKRLSISGEKRKKIVNILSSMDSFNAIKVLSDIATTFTNSQSSFDEKIANAINVISCLTAWTSEKFISARALASSNIFVSSFSLLPLCFSKVEESGASKLNDNMKRDLIKSLCEFIVASSSLLSIDDPLLLDSDHNQDNHNSSRNSISAVKGDNDENDESNHHLNEFGSAASMNQGDVTLLRDILAQEFSKTIIPVCIASNQLEEGTGITTDAASDENSVLISMAALAGNALLSCSMYAAEKSWFVPLEVHRGMYLITKSCRSRDLLSLLVSEYWFSMRDSIQRKLAYQQSNGSSSEEFQQLIVNEIHILLDVVFAIIPFGSSVAIDDTTDINDIEDHDAFKRDMREQLRFLMKPFGLPSFQYDIHLPFLGQCQKLVENWKNNPVMWDPYLESYLHALRAIGPSTIIPDPRCHDGLRSIVISLSDVVMLMVMKKIPLCHRVILHSVCITFGMLSTFLPGNLDLVGNAIYANILGMTEFTQEHERVPFKEHQDHTSTVSILKIVSQFECAKQIAFSSLQITADPNGSDGSSMKFSIIPDSPLELMIRVYNYEFPSPWTGNLLGRSRELLLRGITNVIMAMIVSCPDSIPHNVRMDTFKQLISSVMDLPARIIMQEIKNVANINGENAPIPWSDGLVESLIAIQSMLNEAYIGVLNKFSSQFQDPFITAIRKVLVDYLLPSNLLIRLTHGLLLLPPDKMYAQLNLSNLSRPPAYMKRPPTEKIPTPPLMLAKCIANAILVSPESFVPHQDHNGNSNNGSAATSIDFIPYCLAFTVQALSLGALPNSVALLDTDEAVSHLIVIESFLQHRRHHSRVWSSHILDTVTQLCQLLERACQNGLFQSNTRDVDIKEELLFSERFYSVVVNEGICRDKWSIILSDDQSCERFFLIIQHLLDIIVTYGFIQCKIESREAGITYLEFINNIFLLNADDEQYQKVTSTGADSNRKLFWFTRIKQMLSTTDQSSPTLTLGSKLLFGLLCCIDRNMPPSLLGNISNSFQYIILNDIFGMEARKVWLTTALTIGQTDSRFSFTSASVKSKEEFLLFFQSIQEYDQTLTHRIKRTLKHFAGGKKKSNAS